MKEDLFEEFFGISPANLIILKDISSTLMKCGKYGFMNDCRTFMTMFLKRTIRLSEGIQFPYTSKHDSTHEP